MKEYYKDYTKICIFFYVRKSDLRIAPQEYKAQIITLSLSEWLSFWCLLSHLWSDICFDSILTHSLRTQLFVYFTHRYICFTNLNDPHPTFTSLPIYNICDEGELQTVLPCLGGHLIYVSISRALRILCKLTTSASHWLWHYLMGDNITRTFP